MYASATMHRHTSFMVEGAKYVAREAPHRVMVIMSTTASNVCSRTLDGKPFLGMEVWESWGEGHTKAGRRGMDIAPGGLQQCIKKGTVAEVFAYLEDDFDRMTCLEDVFKKAGIGEYTFYICGYHIHGARALPYERQFCALDWYSQTASDRMAAKNRYDHWIILDQVCPTEFWKGEVFQPLSPFEGWDAYDIGS